MFMSIVFHEIYYHFDITRNITISIFFSLFNKMYCKKSNLCYSYVLMKLQKKIHIRKILYDKEKFNNF